MQNKKNNNNKLLITISQENENDELFRILNNPNNLPFKLPNHIVFPIGKKEFARRARMLMLAGMEFLKEKYPNMQDNRNLEDKITINKNKEEKDNNLANF